MSEVNHWRRVVLWWLGTSIVATLLVVLLLAPILPPGNGSVEASGQVVDNTVLLGISTPVAMAVLVYFIYALIAFRERDTAAVRRRPADPRRRPDPDLVAGGDHGDRALPGRLRDDPPARRRRRRRPGTESDRRAGRRRERALQVQVIAQQWKFTYRWPSYGGVETSTLELPANRMIEFHVTSLDVIHSFWAYQLGVKADANPGFDNIAYVTTKGPLTFDIHCAELCGVWHGYMFDNGTGRDAEPLQHVDRPAAPPVRAGHQEPAAVFEAVLPGPAEERWMSTVAISAQRQPAWRKLLGFNLLTGIVLAVVGWLVGSWIGARIHAPSLDYFADTGENDIGIMLGYLFGVIGFLVGLGFANYPIKRMLGHPASLAEHESEGEGVMRYFRLCTDHKVVSIQYIVGIGVFFLVGGINAMLIRTELLQPNVHVFGPNQYVTLVGMHGAMMMGMMTSGVLGPFANWLVPLMIGSRRMAFPRIESFTFWLLMAAGVVLVTTIFMGGFQTGWTGYQPLGDQGTAGYDAYIGFFALVGVSMCLLGLNLIVTIITMRAPGMTWNRLPIFVWSVLATAVLMMLAAPMLIAALLMGAFDRTVQTGFFLGQRRRQLVPVPEPVLGLRPPGGVHRGAAGLRDRPRAAAGVLPQAAVGVPAGRRRHAGSVAAQLLRVAAPPVRQWHQR